MKITASIQIKAPIETVFQVFSDLDKIGDRVKGIDTIELLEGSSQMALGTKWKETRTMMGKVATETMWVSEIDSPNKYVVEAASHGTEYCSVYTFKSEGENTSVTVVFGGKPISMAAKFMSVTALLFSKSLQKMLLDDMEDLKKICEQD